MTVEISGRDAVQLRAQVHVARRQRLDRALHVLLGEDVDHLRRHRQQRAHRLGLQQRRAHVHGDHHVGPAQLAHLGHGQVVHQAAVHQLAAVDVGRRQQPGHRHARPHGLCQRPAAEHHALAGADVGGHQRHRQRQVFEHRLAQVGAHQLVEEQLDLLPGHHPRGCGQALRRDAQLAARQEALQDVLAAQAQVAVVATVDEQVVPVDDGELAAHALGADAGGPGAGHQGAHAGAGDAVHRHAQPLQHLQHADVRRAASATAAQHQADAGRVCRLGRVGGQGHHQAGPCQPAGEGRALCHEQHGLIVKLSKVGPAVQALAHDAGLPVQPIAP